MLRQILESELGLMTDAEFREALELATTDIKTNRVAFGKRTSLTDMIEITWISLKAMERGKVA